MIENFALHYIVASTENAVFLLPVLLGAITAGMATRIKTSISRVQYFASSASVSFGLSLTSLMGLNLIDAITNNYAALIVGIEIAVSFVAGFFLCILAKERGNDAYGKPEYAALAFIPLFNLLLLFAPGKSGTARSRVEGFPLFSGLPGIGVGIAFLFLAIIVPRSIEEQVAVEAEQDLARTEYAFDKLFVSTSGVRGAFLHWEREMITPSTIDEITTLIDAQADGEVMNMIFSINASAEDIDTEIFLDDVKSNACGYMAFSPVIDAGGTVNYSYYDAEDAYIGTVTITKDVCENA